VSGIKNSLTPYDIPASTDLKLLRCGPNMPNTERGDWCSKAKAAFSNEIQPLYSDAHSDKYLGGYACNRSQALSHYRTLDSAQQACSIMGDCCGGVTQTGSNAFETREGTWLKRSPSQETSWIKQGTQPLATFADGVRKTCVYSDKVYLRYGPADLSDTAALDGLTRRCQRAAAAYGANAFTVLPQGHTSCELHKRCTNLKKVSGHNYLYATNANDPTNPVNGHKRP
jgi:hypothetical protein